MDIRKVTEQLSVSPQIGPEHVSQIAAAGFRAIICNRPDGESPDQPDFATIAAAAREQGLAIIHQPVVSATMSLETGRTFGEALNTLPGPVFAYCRSGTRCITLWALSALPDQSQEAILDTARNAGYDLDGVVQHFAAGL